MQDIRVAAIATINRPGEPQANLANHESWARRAADEGAELILFPEMGITGYWTDSRLWHVAEPVPGPSIAELERVAKDLGVIVCAGIAEKEHDIVFNSQALVGPNGYIGKSRKLHIPIAEYAYWRGGYDAPVHDTGKCRVGINICFDNWFCESSRLVTLKGAEVLLSPWVWSKGKSTTKAEAVSANRSWKEHGGRVFPARAYENGLFVVVVNASGPVDEKGFLYNGHPVCLVYDPQGQKIAESDDDATGEAMVIATLKAETIDARRAEGHYHPKYRRPEAYSGLTERR